jgi:hypothetical protein
VPLGIGIVIAASKAASLLNTIQSAISKSIADLEHTIGVRLLDRNVSGRQARDNPLGLCLMGADPARSLNISASRIVKRLALANSKGHPGAMPSDLWDKLPECSGSIHHLRD